MVHCYSNGALQFRRERAFARGFLSTRYKYSHYVQTKYLPSKSHTRDDIDVLAADDPWSIRLRSKVNFVSQREGLSIEKLTRNPWAEYNLRRGLTILPMTEYSESSLIGSLHVPEAQLPFDSLREILSKLDKIEMVLNAVLAKENKDTKDSDADTDTKYIDPVDNISKNIEIDAKSIVLMSTAAKSNDETKASFTLDPVNIVASTTSIELDTKSIFLVNIDAKSIEPDNKYIALGSSDAKSIDFDTKSIIPMSTATMSSDELESSFTFDPMSVVAKSNVDMKASFALDPMSFVANTTNLELDTTYIALVNTDAKSIELDTKYIAFGSTDVKSIDFDTRSIVPMSTGTMSNDELESSFTFDPMSVVAKSNVEMKASFALDPMSIAANITSIESDTKNIALVDTEDIGIVAKSTDIAAKSVGIAAKSSVGMEPAFSIVPISSDIDADYVTLESSDDEVQTLDPHQYDSAAFQCYPIGDGRQHSLLRYLPNDFTDFAQCEFLDASHLVQVVISDDDAKLAFVDKLGDRYCAKCGPFSIVEVNDNENERVWVRTTSGVPLILRFKSENVANTVVRLLHDMVLSRDHVEALVTPVEQVPRSIEVKDPRLVDRSISYSKSRRRRK